MGADFAMLIGCDVRKAFSEDSLQATEALVTEIKQRSSLDAVLRINESGSMPLSVLKVVNGPDGLVETTTSLDDLIASVKRLEQLESRCDGCAMRTMNTPFGCTGYIRYPITAATEEWLVEQMGEEGSLGAKLRKQLAQEIGAHGSIGSNWRARQILEREKPAEKLTGNRRLLLSLAKVSGDELIEWLFFSGLRGEEGSPYWQVDARTALSLLIILDRVEIDGQSPQWLALEAIEALGALDEASRTSRVHLKPLREEEVAAGPFEAYFRALYITFVHNAMLGVYA